MRRRSRRAPNTSESTGKIGQELPSNQPAPLVPLYPDDTSRAHQGQSRPQQGQSKQQIPRQSAPPQQLRPQWNEPPGSGRLEVETQPEMPVIPRLTQDASGRSPQAPKGFVVLAIG